MQEWLRPYVCHFEWEYEVDPTRAAYAVMAKHLRVLDAEYPDCFERWVRYLAATPLQYWSPARFAQTFGAWGPPPEDTRVSKDEAIKKGFEAGLRGVDDRSIPAAGFMTIRDFKKWLDIQLAKQDDG